MLDTDLLPSADDLAAFAEHGWYRSRKIVPEDVLDAAVEGSERYYRGEMDDGPAIPEFSEPRPPLPPGLRKHDYASLRNRELAALRSLPAIAAIAARLLDVDTIRLWHDQLLYKPPSGPDAPGNVGWHTDRSYWRSCTSENMVTAWVPFHDCDVEMGTITMLDGSNRWHESASPEHARFFIQDLEGQEAELGQKLTGRTLRKMPVELERGQVSFHHCLTFHGSGPNRSDRPRRSLAIHMQPGDNRWSGEADHCNNTLCRPDEAGNPDYTDPDYCPVLWSASGSS